MDSPSEPNRIRLTEDFLLLQVGFGIPAGTELIRHNTGQYVEPGQVLGTWCVSHLGAIEGKYEVIES